LGGESSGGGECIAGDIGDLALDVVFEISFGCVVEVGEFEVLSAPPVIFALLEGVRRRTPLEVARILVGLADEREGELNVLAPAGGLRQSVGDLQVYGHPPSSRTAVRCRTMRAAHGVDHQPPVLGCGGGQGRESEGAGHFLFSHDCGAHQLCPPAEKVSVRCTPPLFSNQSVMTHA